MGLKSFFAKFKASELPGFRGITEIVFLPEFIEPTYHTARK